MCNLIGVNGPPKWPTCLVPPLKSTVRQHAHGNSNCRSAPEDFDEHVGKACEDVEATRPVREKEYLLKLRQFAKDAEDFVREKRIALFRDRYLIADRLQRARRTSGHEFLS